MSETSWLFMAHDCYTIQTRLTLFKLKTVLVQSGAACYSLGFEDENLGNSLGWWAANVATCCPSRPGNCPNSYLQNLVTLSVSYNKHPRIWQN